MAQEPARQRCVTATEIKLEILDVKDRDPFVRVYLEVLSASGSIPLCAGPHGPMSHHPWAHVYTIHYLL
jgi:hypothetical protein